MTLNITGDVELTLEGGALHGQQQLTDQNDDGEDPRTVIVQAINFLPKDNLVGSFELVRVSSEAGFDSGDGVIGLASPQWGAFDPSVVEDQWIVFAVLQDLDGYSGSLYSSDGSVSLPTASGQGQISGTFTANLQGQLERDGSTSPVEIQIVADFDSLPASGGF